MLLRRRLPDGLVGCDLAAACSSLRNCCSRLLAPSNKVPTVVCLELRSLLLRLLLLLLLLDDIVVCLFVDDDDDELDKELGTCRWIELSRLV